VRSNAAVAGAVIADAGRVLLIRRASPVGSLRWTFPSGKLDPDETPSDAAAREALEEAGVWVAGGVRGMPPVGRQGAGGVAAGGDRGGVGRGRGACSTGAGRGVSAGAALPGRAVVSVDAAEKPRSG
jgi:hypothetical protein